MKQHWRNVRPYVLPFPIYCLVRLLGMTVRIRSEGYEKIKDLPTGKIMAGWHGRTFLATQFFRKKGVWTIISQSKDGDMQDVIFRRFGFKTIRGSTGRGGMKAAIESIRVLKEGASMAFTPDGPRGPSGIVQEGIMLMARKSGAAIIPVGVASKPCWHARTWDRYMVPKPFARGIMVFGDPIYVPAGSSPEEQEAIRLHFEQEMHRLEAYAESRV